MLLEADYKTLVRFRDNANVKVADLNGLCINRLQKDGFLIYFDIMEPNPEPNRMINGAYRKEIAVGHKLGISEEGIKALLEYEEKMGDKIFERANIKKANTRATIALIISILGFISSTLVSLLKK
jgi:hypothetical protein